MKEYKQVLFMEMSYYIEGGTEEEKLKMEEEAEERIKEKVTTNNCESEGKIEKDELKKDEKSKDKVDGIIGERKKEEEEENKRKKDRYELEKVVDDKLIEHYYGRYLELEEVYGIKDKKKFEQEQEVLKVLIRKDKARMNTMEKGEGRETKRQDVLSFLNESK